MEDVENQPPAIDELRPRTQAHARSLKWLGQSKPTDWITAMAACLAIIIGFRTGLFDAKLAEISARTERLNVETIRLEQRKESLRMT